MAVSRYLEGGFGHIAAYRILHDLRMQLYEKLQQLAMGFHTRQQSGTVAAKMIGDVETIMFDAQSSNIDTAIDNYITKNKDRIDYWVTGRIG